MANEIPDTDTDTDTDTAPRRFWTREKLLPLLLIPVAVLVDQAVKQVVVENLPLGRPVEVVGDLLRFTYVKNDAIAFSLGRRLPADVRRAGVLILPIVALAVILLYYLRTEELSRTQHWLVAALIGGGLGNYLDRLLRVGGVVDFVDVKFFGIFGWPRWPTFNVADSTVVITSLLLLVTFVREEIRQKRGEKTE